MFEIGRLCVKLAGRDAGKKCTVVEILDNNFVLIDGETRRRKCNVMHLEPLDQVLKIEDKASHEDVASAFKELGIELKETKRKEAKPRPKKIRKGRQKKPVEEKTEKKKAVETKKAAPKKAEKSAAKAE
jgi:large subunit ribosomal protein L14e